MLIDELAILRGDGSNSDINAAEDGYTSMTRDATTGRAVIKVDKTAKKGIPICVITKPVGGCDRTFNVVIEAADAENFSGTVDNMVAVFPACGLEASGSEFFVRRIHTQKKYIRTRIYCEAAGTTGTCDFLVFAGIGLMDNIGHGKGAVLPTT